MVSHPPPPRRAPRLLPPPCLRRRAPPPSSTELRRDPPHRPLHQGATRSPRRLQRREPRPLPALRRGTSVDRIRVSVTHGIRAKLCDAILSDHKETLKQNYYNAMGELASDKVLDEMLKWSGDPMDPPWSSPGAAAPSAPASTSPPPRTSSRATSKTPRRPCRRHGCGRKPIAGAVAGFAVIAGFEIALACDLFGGPRRQVRQHLPELRRAPLSAAASPPSSAERPRLHRAPLSAAASPPSSSERLRASTEAAASTPRLHRSRRISAASPPSSAASPSTYLHPLHLFDEIPKRNEMGARVGLL
uniref:Uncharacterized protein n=1 Tax=Ananas comosus var. bracteatus TaxID=296719 RepID=A0A6V7Q6B9_ANACO|nr:unnamed protein product [Ananas comosus var. bracteatus]